MEALAAFRLRLGDVLSEKHQNVVSLETGLSLLSRTNEDILKTNSSLLKERDALVGKVQELEIAALHAGRDGDNRVAAMRDQRDVVQRSLDGASQALDAARADLASARDELATLKLKAMVDAAEDGGVQGSHPSMHSEEDNQARLTKRAVESFLEHVRVQMVETVGLTHSTAGQAREMATRLTALEQAHAAAQTEAVEAVANVKSLCALAETLQAALSAARAAQAASDGARRTAEGEAKAATVQVELAHASLAAKAQLIDSLQAQLTAAADAHSRHSDMLAQATGALKTQDTTLQKLRTEVLSLHDTVDKHDAAMAAVDAQHKRALSSRDTEVTSARAQLAEAHAELSKVQAKAKDAAHAADAALSAVQSDLLAARQDCARARQELVSLETRIRAVEKEAVVKVATAMQTAEETLRVRAAPIVTTTASAAPTAGLPKDAAHVAARHGAADVHLADTVQCLDMELEPSSVSAALPSAERSDVSPDTDAMRGEEDAPTVCAADITPPGSPALRSTARPAPQHVDAAAHSDESESEAHDDDVERAVAASIMAALLETRGEDGVATSVRTSTVRQPPTASGSGSAVLTTGKRAAGGGGGGRSSAAGARLALDTSPPGKQPAGTAEGGLRSAAAGGKRKRAAMAESGSVSPVNLAPPVSSTTRGRSASAATSAKAGATSARTSAGGSTRRRGVVVADSTDEEV